MTSAEATQPDYDAEDLSGSDCPGFAPSLCRCCERRVRRTRQECAPVAPTTPCLPPPAAFRRRVPAALFFFGAFVRGLVALARHAIGGRP